MRFFCAITALALAVPLASALPKITRKGRYLYDESGARFYIKGVAYQPQGELADSSAANEANGGFPEPSSYVDPLSSGANCTRDIPYLTQLGVNAVRVYSVNAQNNHDECMTALDKAGIYVLLDVSLPLNGSIDRASPSWSTNLLNEYLTTINAFATYPNVLSFNIGNEVISRSVNTNALPYVKAAARDVKAYLKSISSSALVGYAATDGPDDFRKGVADYLTCGNDTVTVDLFGLNSYAWCGNSSYTASTWNNVVSNFQDLTVPVYMSEFGCITSPPRYWTEVPVLYSDPMAQVFSGGVAFSYFAANNGPYALVDVSDDGKTVTPNADFTRLSTQFNATKGANSPAMGSVTASELTCPAESDTLLASTNLPPTPNQKTCACVNDNSLACHVIPATASNPVLIGSLIDTACSLLGQVNSTVTCEGSIGSNGTTGVYGPLSMCSPEIKLNYAMSAYWAATGQKDTSCNFDNNATLVANPPNTPQDANDAAQSCINGQPPVTTPTATNTPGPINSDGGSSTGSAAPGSSSSGSSQPHSGATATSMSVAAIIFGIVGGAMVV